MTEFVSGAISTVTDLGKDEAAMLGWLKDQPSRLGLGDLKTGDGVSDDDRNFLATDDARCFSIDVQLGQLEASRGFEVLDHWARNRALHPDKTHVAVLVTEAMSDRYGTTLETLAEHLPLVVVELQVWKGQNEAIVVPHIALSSDDVDISDTPAARAAEAVSKARDLPAETEARSDADADADETTTTEVVTNAEAAAAEAEAMAQAGAEAEADEPENKDDTGVGNPWGLPASGADEGAIRASSSGSTGLLTKVGR